MATFSKPSAQKSSVWASLLLCAGHGYSKTQQVVNEVVTRIKLQYTRINTSNYN